MRAIIDRYNIVPPEGLSEERTYVWQQRKGIPVRLRISNLVKSWLEVYWRPTTDNVVLQALLDFNRDALALMFPGPSHRIHEIIITRKREGVKATPPTPRPDLARDPSLAFTPRIQSTFEIPRPIVTKTLFSNLRNRNFTAISITDFDAVELARQFSIMESNLFCAIQAEEILESGQEGCKPPVNVRAVTSLSTVITGWVAESILNEEDLKRRTILVKYFIKLADVSGQHSPVASVLTFNGVALHDIAQFRDVAFHTCGSGFFNYFSPTTHMDGSFQYFWSIIILCMISFDSVGCAAEAKVAARQCSKARRSCSKLSRVSLTLAPDGPSRCSVFRCVLWTAASIFLLIYHNQVYTSLISLSVERGIHLIGRLPWLLRRS